jgi:hypothetical protein
VIGGPEPPGGEVLNFGNRVEAVLGQPFVPNVAVEPFEYAFCWGFPGWMYSIRIPFRLVNPTMAELTYSEPLSQRITLGTLATA